MIWKILSLLSSFSIAGRKYECYKRAKLIIRLAQLWTLWIKIKTGLVRHVYYWNTMEILNILRYSWGIQPHSDCFSVHTCKMIPVPGNITHSLRSIGITPLYHHAWLKSTCFCVVLESLSLLYSPPAAEECLVPGSMVWGTIRFIISSHVTRERLQ